MNPTEEQLLDALRRVAYPGFTRDVVSSGSVRGVTRAPDGSVRVVLDPAGADPATTERLVRAVREGLAETAGQTPVEIQFVGAAQPSSALRMAGAPAAASTAGGIDAGLIPEVRHVVAVASGKGGVGKSTVAVNLAVALAVAGQRVGLLDADIYGPSIPLMTGIQEAPGFTADRKLVPFERHGVRLMSLGFLVDPESAVIWRGPMVMKALEQLLRDVNWGALDVMIVDMPPGTGDAQLTLSQRVRLAGAVIVTTPQDVALADAIKGVAMFRKVDVPVLGIVENMSYFLCPHCAGRTEIFSHGGGRREAARLGVPFLGEVPLDPAIRSAGDAGTPIVALDRGAPQAQAFHALASSVLQALDAPAERPAQASAGLFDRFRKVWRRE